MNRSTRAAAALLAALLLGGCTTTAVSTPSTATTTTTSVGEDSEQLAVRRAFEDYKAASGAQDGEAVVRVVSKRMLALYSEYKEMALTMPEGGVRQHGASATSIVYTLRAEFGAAELRGMTPADLVAASVSKGLMGKRSADFDLDVVTVVGDTAKASVATRAPRGELSFHKESGEWKFDAAELLSFADEAIAAMAEQEGTTVDQVVDRNMTLRYGAERLRQLKQPLER